MAIKDKSIATVSGVSTITIAELLSSSSIISSKLSGSRNYLSWAVVIKTFLISKKRLGYIDEDKPEGPSAVWAKKDAQGPSYGIVWSLMLFAM